VGALLAALGLEVGAVPLLATGELLGWGIGDCVGESGGSGDCVGAIGDSVGEFGGRGALVGERDGGVEGDAVGLATEQLPAVQVPVP